ncbi:MAG TPA: HAD hydrolase family protein [Vicinamibacterales bacterium]|nr:HAD hydrolase family protein [Vicinamibacterales bacterium]
MTLPSHQIEMRSRKLKLLLLDVDGVLTDGSVTMCGDGTETKTFSIRDGAAIVWAQNCGLPVGLLSGRASDATGRRAAELGIEILVNGTGDKQEAFSHLLRSRGLMDTEVAYMGDDLLDLAVLRRAGLSAAPADAAEEVRAAVHWVSRHNGGRGAVREFVEMLLKNRGRWDPLVRTLSM